ncbi:hypothetical protein, partial [Pseudomonas aeruginosa]|uniref:hypothetical protein n=1 Tax=Pseudomonas aeruginosa TaxID=287 RepID=UPI0039687FF2
CPPIRQSFVKNTYRKRNPSEAPQPLYSGAFSRIAKSSREAFRAFSGFAGIPPYGAAGAGGRQQAARNAERSGTGAYGLF